MAFNVAGCVNHLIKSAHSSSQHSCARYVRQAMEAGGLNTSTRPNWAWQYINWLPSQGWQLVGKCFDSASQAEYTSTQARPGDIAVYQKPGVGGSEPGHICMWSGQNWISDFKQNRMGVYKSDVNAYVFRYTGEINNSGPIMDENGESVDGDFSCPGSGVSLDLSELDGDNLADLCPKDVEFKGLWSRYQVKGGVRTQSMVSLCKFSPGSPGCGSDLGLSGELVEDACRFICREENGSDWSVPLTDKFLRGYQLKGEGHKTYGFGLMYGTDDNGQAFLMESRDRGNGFSEEDQRRFFRNTIKSHLKAIEQTGLQLTDRQKIVLCHRRHAGITCFNSVVRDLKALGRPATSAEFKEFALKFMRGCKNWNIYGKGWTNGINREAAFWG